VSRKDTDLVGFRVALEHGHLTCSQLVLVLLGVLRGDHELGLFVLEGVGQMTILERRGIGFQATGPLRNGAVCVTSLLRAQRREGRSEFGGFFGGNRGHHTAGEQREGQDTE